MIVISLCVAASGGSAQSELRPLDDILSGNPETSYAYTRCAAFYSSILQWAGSGMGQEEYDGYKEYGDALYYVSIAIRESQSAKNLAQIGRSVDADVQKITDLYERNYQRSYASSGDAWTGNSLWESDAETCKPIAEIAQDAAKAIGVR
ncbi:hypothetical protein [Poseidonocella sedimentorum]|nr:hypothetical protein [Poseidonocella sedimentorum]